jgi:hypothetical protein
MARGVVTFRSIGFGRAALDVSLAPWLLWDGGRTTHAAQVQTAPASYTIDIAATKDFHRIPTVPVN